MFDLGPASERRINRMEAAGDLRYVISFALNSFRKRDESAIDSIIRRSQTSRS
jgi:hypothetical protein